MPILNSRPRRDLDAAFAVLTIAQDEFFAAATRVVKYEQSPHYGPDGEALPVPLRFRIRHNTTRRNLRDAATAYRAAQHAYAAAYPRAAAKLFGATA